MVQHPAENESKQTLRERIIRQRQRITELEAEVERLRTDCEIARLASWEAGERITELEAELATERKEVERLREQLHLANVDQCNAEADLAAERNKSCEGCEYGGACDIQVAAAAGRESTVYSFACNRHEPKP